MNRFTTTILFFCCAMILWPSTSAFGQRRDRQRNEAYQRNTSAIRGAFKEVVADVSKSTVKIQCDGKDVALGAIVTKDGFILSKASEIRGKILVRLHDGQEIEAKLVGVEDKHDLAMLKIDTKEELQPVSWRSSKNLEVGSWIVTPGITSEPVAFGVVSVTTRTMNRFDYPPDKVNPNSGYLGVSLGQSKLGPVIGTIAKDSAAEKAGLQVADVILAVAGKPVKDPDTLILTMSNYRVGDVVKLKIKREEEESDVKVTLGKRPNTPAFSFDRTQFQNGMARDREISMRNTGFPIALQHDTVLKARDCGGPLVDLDGKVVGINIASSGRVESYAIPAEIVQGLLPELMSGKLAPKNED